MAEEQQGSDGDTTGAAQSQAAEVASSQRLDESQDMFDRVYDRLTRTGPDALADTGEVVPRRKYTSVIDGSVCSPGVFVDGNGDYIDFKLTVRALSSREEIAALRGISDQQDAAGTPYMLAFASLYAVNGKRITDVARREFLWEALGPAGRQLAVYAYNEIGGVSPVAMGKFQREFSVE